MTKVAGIFVVCRLLLVLFYYHLLSSVESWHFLHFFGLQRNSFLNSERQNMLCSVLLVTLRIPSRKQLYLVIMRRWMACRLAHSTLSGTTLLMRSRKVSIELRSNREISCKLDSIEFSGNMDRPYFFVPLSCR